MDLYLDCEWADVLASELVSIALVSADEQHSFYAERDPLPTNPVPWVRSVVYPLLKRGDAALDDNTLTRRLRDFLASLSSPRIHYDSGHDRALCQYVIDGLDVPAPEGPTPTVTWVRLEGLHSELERWWRAHPEQQPKRHHALVDAMALRGAARRDARRLMFESKEIRMYSKELVDAIRLTAAQHGLRITMTRGRDLISLLLVGRHYSAAIAAVRAGNIPPINIETDRVTGLRLQYGTIVDDLMRFIESHLRQSH